MPTRLPPALACERVEWLPAEASARRFARLHRPRAVARPTAVAMLFHPATQPAEVRRVARATELLGAAGLPVPVIHEFDADGRWILQEDLGDTTLARARAQGSPVADAYSQAVALLPAIQPLQLPTSPRPGLVASRLMAELEQFATLALALPEGPGAGLRADFERVVAAAEAQPTVLCHRDYHSRNLMLLDGRVRVVDHQDALPGPIAYDRVSLAYDPYVDLADPIRDRIAGQVEGTACVAVQRLAKAIGTFADKGGPWIVNIAPAARQARRLIARDGLGLTMLDLALATLIARAPAAASTAP